MFEFVYVLGWNTCFLQIYDLIKHILFDDNCITLLLYVRFYSWVPTNQWYRKVMFIFVIKFFFNDTQAKNIQELIFKSNFLFL